MLQFLSNAEDDAVWERTFKAKFLCHSPTRLGEERGRDTGLGLL